MSTRQKCCFQKPDGTACGAACIASGDYRFFHSPDKAEARKAAGSKGGRRSRKRAVVPSSDAEDVTLATVGDVTAALATVFNQVRRGQVDSRTGNCLGLLAGQLLKALQESELASEIEELAKEIREIKQSGNGRLTQTSPDAPVGSAGDPADGIASAGAFAG